MNMYKKWKVATYFGVGLYLPLCYVKSTVIYFDENLLPTFMFIYNLLSKKSKFASFVHFYKGWFDEFDTNVISVFDIFAWNFCENWATETCFTSNEQLQPLLFS